MLLTSFESLHRNSKNGLKWNITKAFRRPGFHVFNRLNNFHTGSDLTKNSIAKGFTGLWLMEFLCSCLHHGQFILSRATCLGMIKEVVVSDIYEKLAASTVDKIGSRHRQRSPDIVKTIVSFIAYRFSTLGWAHIFQVTTRLNHKTGNDTMKYILIVGPDINIG